MKVSKTILLALIVPLLLGACATNYSQTPIVRGTLSRTYLLDNYVDSPYPDYVSLVRLPDVNTTSKVIRIK